MKTLEEKALVGEYVLLRQMAQHSPQWYRQHARIAAIVRQWRTYNTLRGV